MGINSPSHLFFDQTFCLDCQLLIFMDCIAHLCFYLYPGLPDYESFIKARAGKIKAQETHFDGYSNGYPGKRIAVH